MARFVAPLILLAIIAAGFVPAFEMFARLHGRPEIVSWKDLAADAAAGRLPNVSWVYSEKADSDHPPYSVCRGEQWVAAQMDALMASPQWPRMAVFITWDDWGGIYDHVDPPVIEREPNGRPIRYGHRVPLLVASPWVRRGYVEHGEASFLSIVRFAFETLGVPLPEGRIRQAEEIGSAFVREASTAAPPRLVPPVCGLTRGDAKR